MTISLISLRHNPHSCSTFTTNLNSSACTFEFIYCNIHLHCASGFPSNSGIQEIRSTYYPQNFLSVWSTPYVQRWHTSLLHWQTWSLRNLAAASSSNSHWTQSGNKKWCNFHGWKSATSDCLKQVRSGNNLVLLSTVQPEIADLSFHDIWYSLYHHRKYHTLPVCLRVKKDRLTKRRTGVSVVIQ